MAVTVIPWRDLEDLDAPRKWGLKVDAAYVCRGREVLLFETRGEAVAQAKVLRDSLEKKAAQ